MADWVKITDLAPATSGGVAVPHDHFLNLDMLVAVSYRDPVVRQGQADPSAEVHLGEPQPIRLYSEEARDQLRAALERRAGTAAPRVAPPEAWGRQHEPARQPRGEV